MPDHLPQTENATGKDKTRIHYQKFHNIFLYITERCQLRCGHCYMGERLERGMVLSLEKAKIIINNTKKLGAKYITFLGGEPTLNPNLPQMVDYAIQLGFEQVMIDTNGLLVERIKKIDPKKLHYVSVSLDGASTLTHEKVRGRGTYLKTLNAIKELVNSGYRVRINCTVMKFNTHQAEELLQLADSIGVKLVNFHTFSEEGNGAINSEWSLSPYDWIAFYEFIEKIKGSYQTSVWYPPTWSTKEKLSHYVSEGFRGCLGCSLDRLSIFPDGRCYVCSVLFDETINFATMTDNGLVLNRERNEFDMFNKAAFKMMNLYEAGCPAEEVLEKNGKAQTPPELISLCRCWKSQA